MGKMSILLVFLICTLFLFAACSDDQAAPAAHILHFSQEMVDVPDGTYLQNQPQWLGFRHTITGFKMGKCEVTYQLWYTVRQWAISNGYQINRGKEGNNGNYDASPTQARYQPVTCVSWRDAIVWCNAYSEMEGLRPVYYRDGGYENPIRNSGGFGSNSINTNAGSYDHPYVDWNAGGYRLPTEGEWQYAASYIDGVNWIPFDSASGVMQGDLTGTPLVAWYDINSSGDTQPVGTRSPNALGIFDMSGNVNEWCWDWNGASPSTAQTNYHGSETIPRYSPMRSVRGGSIISDFEGLMVGLNGSNQPYIISSIYGFRVARNR